MAENKPKECRFYKPRKENNGAASSWQLSYKPDNKFDPWMMFLVIAPQTGVDANENASFDWKEKAITVKLGEADIGEIMSVLQGTQDAAGYKGSLYHQSPAGGNKSVVFAHNENGGFNLKVSAQDKEKKMTGPYYHSVTAGEAAILLTLLRRAVEVMYNW